MAQNSGGLSAEDAGCLLTLGDGVAYVRRPGPDGAVLHVGGNAARILGHDPRGLVSGPGLWRSCLHPDDAASARAAIAAAGEDVVETDYRFRHADGHYLWVRDRFILGTSPRGAAESRVFGCWTDVTPLREAQEECRALASRLDALASQMPIRHRGGPEAVERLTGGVAHEFNNLLGVILGNIEMIELELMPASPQGDYLSRAKQSVLRGADLTRRLMTVAQRRSLDPRPIDLSSFLRGLSDALSSVLGVDVRLDFRIADGLPAVLVDVLQLEDAILNLALNARDAMPEGGEMTIAAEVASPPYRDAGATAGFVCIRISDSGNGMVTDIAERAFEPFFTTKEVGQGTGLGLSIVRGLIEQSGGFAEIESAAGKGTTVSLFLPQAGQAAAGLAAAQRP